MKLGKIFKVFKKGTKAASKQKGKKVEGGFEWPPGVRIGVYGHANSGKTVYFTVLNEECKVAKNLQISVTDNATAGEFLTNYRAIWGMGTATDVGTVVDLREEKKFPDPTQSDRVLVFNAIVDRKKKIPVVTFDYPGKAVSISERHDLNEKVIDFVSGCNGLLFFYDPKTLGAELESQAHVASFVNMLERLAPLHRRLPIPVALVVTKADILSGFSSESQTVLISAEDEHFLAKDYELFLEKVLASNEIASNSAWAGSVRNILVKLKEFLKVVVGRTLNFQIYFVSSTGQTPEKIGTDIGRSIYVPPPKIRPVGVKEPFYWILNSIRGSRRISKIRTLAKFVAILSLIWIGLFSLPYLYHFQYLLPRATEVEDNTLGSRRRSSASQQERTNIKAAYRKYQNAWTAKWLFDRFLVPAERIRSIYDKDMLGEEIRRLDETIRRVTATVRDTAHWPTVDLSTDSLRLTPQQRALEATLEGFHQGDSTSELYTRSGRVLKLWALFKAALHNPSDTLVWDKIPDQVSRDSSFYGKDLNREELGLGRVLTETAAARKEKKERRETVAQAGTRFDQLVEQINSNPSPEYRLGKAVEKLRELKAVLQNDPARQQDVERIDNYLRRAAYFDENRLYKFTLINCPPDHHVHIRVTGRGKSAGWPRDQFLAGYEFSITWRAGDHILIALDEKHVGQNIETWGEKPKELVELKGPFSVFDLDGTISFNTGQVTASCKDDLRARLPQL